MGQPQGQQMYPTVMYMQPSQPGGNMNNYGAPIIVQSNPGSVPQMMVRFFLFFLAHLTLLPLSVCRFLHSNQLL
jgi:hypothetical protein